MKTVKVRNALPLYATAAVWLVAAAILPVYRLGVFIGIALASVAAYAVMEKFGPKETREVRERANSGDENVDRQIEEGRDLLEKLVADAMSTEDEKLRADAGRMKTAGEAIFKALENNAGKASEVRRFMNYYLPTSAELISKYRTIVQTGVDGKNISAAKNSIENSFGMIADAFEKQLDFLYRDDALDIETDIEVLDTVLKSEGLSVSNTSINEKKTGNKGMTMTGGI